MLLNYTRLVQLFSYLSRIDDLKEYSRIDIVMKMTSIRTRPRHNNNLHSSDDVHTTTLPMNSSQLESLIPNTSQYESSTHTKHRQTKSTLQTFEENENKKNSIVMNKSDGIGLNNGKKKEDGNDEQKKNKFFRYRYLRNTRNLTTSTKKFGLIFAFTIFFLFFFLLESPSSSGGNSNRQKQLDDFLNYWVGGINDHPLRALSMYISLYIFSIGKFPLRKTYFDIFTKNFQ